MPIEEIFGNTKTTQDELDRTWQSISPEDQNEINQAFANIGKSFAAFERKLIPGLSPFDRFVAKGPTKKNTEGDYYSRTMGKQKSSLDGKVISR